MGTAVVDDAFVGDPQGLARALALLLQAPAAQPGAASLTAVAGKAWVRNVAANQNADPALIFHAAVQAVQELS